MNPVPESLGESGVLAIKTNEADLPVELGVEGDLTLLLALLQVVHDGVEILQRQAITGLELRPQVVGESHRQVIVHGLEVQLMTDDYVLLVGLISVELFQALLCSRLFDIL